GLMASPDEALQQAQAAAMELVSRDHTTQHYAQQHVRITRDLLRRRGQTVQQGRRERERERQGDAVPSQSRGGR
ncbi:MAG TPA: glycosyltransferase family 1 protein, partial [Paraburkholderia sp.]|nr:glycosyltransferase family 1 protein [Paraburkholderia sp.]